MILLKYCVKWHETQLTHLQHIVPESQVCHKAFKRSSHLKEHLTTHAPGSIPKKVKPTPHRCQTCDKAFQKPSQLMRHERIHTGKRLVAAVCISFRIRLFQRKQLVLRKLWSHNSLGNQIYLKFAYLETNIHWFSLTCMKWNYVQVVYRV